MAKSSFLTSTPFIVISSLAIVGGGVFAYSKLSKKVAERKAENAGNQVDNKDPKKALATTLAQTCFAAFFPSGYPGVWDGTDEAALFSVAKQMFANKIAFADLSESYRKLYSRVFTTDLVSELSSSELAKFYAILKSGLGGALIARKTMKKSSKKTVNLL